MKTRKTVRISSYIEEKELSPELKEYNRKNNFSKKERNMTLNTIYLDTEFIQYLETRRRNISTKEYRSRILNFWKNRDKLLNEIRTLKTDQKTFLNSLVFFIIPPISSNSASYRKMKKAYYKSFLYPI